MLEAIYGREYELRERIFRMLILVGGSLAIMGILECLILMNVKTVKQVILNILTNAAKYTMEGSVTFSVHIESMTEETVCLKITVADTVILPQKIVDRTLIGDVKFLQRSRTQIEEYQQNFEAPEARVLIVDDNDMNLLVERKLLEATKVKIDTAGSGTECLEKTMRKYYHVILLDYMMPEMNGLETLRQLRRQENGLCRESAVVVLSANTAAETEKTFLRRPLTGT